MVMPYIDGESLPVKLFAAPHFLSDDRHHAYDVGLDGNHFLMVRNSQKNAQILGVVVNWGRRSIACPTGSDELSE